MTLLPEMGNAHHSLLYPFLQFSVLLNSGFRLLRFGPDTTSVSALVVSSRL